MSHVPEVATHAVLSPSGSKRWRRGKGCLGSVRMSTGIPRKSNPASRLGTAKHYVSGNALIAGKDNVNDLLGQKVLFVSEVDKPDREAEAMESEINRAGFIVQAEIVIDKEFIDDCNQYMGFVLDYVELHGGELHVEVAVPIDHITAEAEATGRTDVVVVTEQTITVIDAKFGRGKVNAFDMVKPAIIDADGTVLEAAVIEPNSQLAMYLSGALRAYDFFGTVTRGVMIIVQPALNHVSEYKMEVGDGGKAFNAFIAELQLSADLTRDPNAPLNPTSENCFFCPARLSCKAREEKVLDAVLVNFEDLSNPQRKPIAEQRLGQLYELLPLVNEWVKDVTARMFMALDNGLTVINGQGEKFKLVTGAMGNRKWDDEAKVVAAIKEMSIPESIAYKRELLSPAQMEKHAGQRKSRKKGSEAPPPAPIGPLKWKRLQELITQAPGKAEIALESDHRPTRHTLDDGADLFEEIPSPTAAPAVEEIDLFN